MSVPVSEQLMMHTLYTISKNTLIIQIKFINFIKYPSIFTGVTRVDRWKEKPNAQTLFNFVGKRNKQTNNHILHDTKNFANLQLGKVI